MEREGRLESPSEIIVAITPANTGRPRINNTDVKKIDQQYGGKKRKALIIDRFLDFNKVQIELIETNKLLSPTMCNGTNMRSLEE